MSSAALPPSAPSRGPYLQLACFCETVINDQDGTLTLVRVVDQLTNTATGVEPPPQMPPFVTNTLKLVISLKPGEARGRYAIRVRPEDPSGTQLTTSEVPIHLEGGNRGINMVTPFQFVFQLEGLYWFDVFFVAGDAEEVLLTRMPLQVLYQPQRIAPSPS